jgi:hypothetical protein
MTSGARYHLAQVNIGRVRAPLSDPIMAEFAGALNEINALAESSPGFVWRLKDDSGNATSIAAFPDPLIIVNLSVWTDVASLHTYAYRTVHAKFFARRAAWFEKFEPAHLALWWVPVGEMPTVNDAKERLASIDQNGATPFAFTFKQAFPAPEAAA